MFGREDNTFHELREKSIEQWIEEISQHEDVVVRGGAVAAKDYINDLKKKIANLENQNKLKDSYLKKLKSKL